ncbi:hypothetical protein [Planktotalea sp.]|uniref:hypothetical protein n=1 Tax=Planktotalea sp. TaxID=2029877 RepID=UPI003D6BF1DE
MTKFFSLVASCALLAACADPLANVDKLSSVDLADDAVTVGALEDARTAQAEGGFFSGLFSRNSEPTEPSAADAAVGAALEDAGAIASAETAVESAADAIQPAPKTRGLLGFIRGKNAAEPAQAALAAPADPVIDAASAAEETSASMELTSAVVPEAIAPSAAQAKPRKGFFNRLAGARGADKTNTQDANVRTASLGPVSAPKRSNRNSGAFAKRNKKHTGPDVQIVPYGTALSSGTVARVCDLPSGRLGKEVGKFPERGRGYKIFDSNPGGAGARPFYVTGFDDKCARTFTAALALFGSPTMHEQLRYGLPSSVQPYSTTDQAYEGIKRSVCGVGKKKPCGAKISALEKDTVFISIYDRLGSNSSWSNVLLHKGWVLAADRKS